jgi:hypothetical protein
MEVGKQGLFYFSFAMLYIFLIFIQITLIFFGDEKAFLNQNKLDDKLLTKAIELYRSKYTTELKPKRGRYSSTLSAKFFENHPREVVTGGINSINPTTANNNEITTTETNLNDISAVTPFDTISNGSKELSTNMSV